MGLKRGRIVEETTPPVKDARIHRFRLDTGDQVYLPREVARRLVENHSPADEFFFVQRGLLGRTAWAGTLAELRQAVASGAVVVNELGSFRLPPSAVGPAGWAPVEEGLDHVMVGRRLPELRAMFTKHGRHEQAAQLSSEAWVANGEAVGFCIAHRDDASYGSVWCSLDRGHSEDHRSECPDCWLVRMIMSSAG